MGDQDALHAEVQGVHHRFGVVVLQHSDDRNRTAGKAPLDQSIDRRGVHGSVLTVEQYEIEPGIAQDLAQTRISQANRTRVDRATGIKSRFDGVGTNGSHCRIPFGRVRRSRHRLPANGDASHGSAASTTSSIAINSLFTSADSGAVAA